MNELKLTRFCCRRTMLTSVDMVEKTLDYNQVHDTMTTNPYVTVKTNAVSDGFHLPDLSVPLEERTKCKNPRKYLAR